MKIQEAYEDITIGRNSFPSPKTFYIEENTQRTKKQTITRKKMHGRAPWA